MAKESRKLTGTEGNPTVATSLEAAFRLRARAWIDAIVEEEIEAALGARVARVGAERYGYRPLPCPMSADDESRPDDVRDAARPRHDI